MATPQQLPDRGSLRDTGLPVLLLTLYRDRFVGRLSLTRSRTLKTFTFQDGAPVTSESNLPAERLTAILEDAGTLTREGRDRVNKEVTRRQCQEGVALLELKLLEPKRLFEGLREQLRRRLIECFGWADGDFELEKSEKLSDEVQPFRTDPYALVQEGLQNHWSIDRMLESLGHRMGEYPRPGASLAEVARRLSLDAMVERMIASMSGQQTLGAVVGAAATSPGALAAFCVLDAAGALHYSDAPTRSDDGAGLPAFEIEITDAGESAENPEPRRASDGGGTRARGTDTSASATASSSNSSRSSAAAAEMEAEIRERLGRLAELDHYQILGVERDAARGAIRKAYLIAAKRYHPDALTRLGLHRLKNEAGQVFAQIAQANEILSDDGKRSHYDAELAGGASDIDVTSIAQAETFYRKGEILVRMGDFRGALEYLQNAVRLFPDECVYQSDLAWAYYKKAPSEPKLAKEHLQRALELEPDNQVALFRHGVIDRSE